MAKAPTEKQVEKLQAQSNAKDETKTVRQEVQGKDFINYGQGVIPETIWRTLPGKKIEDSEAIE